MQLKNVIKKQGKRVTRFLQSATEVNVGLQRAQMKPTINMDLQLTAGVVLEQVHQMLSIK